jgi:hypothetical protein
MPWFNLAVIAGILVIAGVLVFTQSHPADATRSPRVKCTGKLVDARGNLLAEAKVAAYKMVGDGWAGNIKLLKIGEATTKADGAFVFETQRRPKRGGHIMGGYIVAAKDGLALGWGTWEMYKLKEVKIKLGKPKRLEGVILDEAGEPIPGAAVRANLLRTTKRFFRKDMQEWLPGVAPLEWLGTSTDDKGKFRFSNIPPECGVDLFVTAPGRATTYTYQFEPPADSKSGAGPRFKAGQTNAKLVLPAEGRIEGKVVDRNTGEGVAGVKLAVVPTSSGAFFYRFICVSGKDGAFSVGGLQSGRYIVRGNAGPEGTMRAYAQVESGETASDVIVNWPWPHVVQRGIGESANEPQAKRQSARLK